jgi:hypothetical protein
MSGTDFAARRAELARQIAGQRQELSEAYRDLGKPLQYAQTGFKGYQALRQNAWLIALAPSAIGIVTGLLGLKKDKSAAKWPFFRKRKSKPEGEAEELESSAAHRAKPLLKKLIGHGVTAFKLYRQIRPYIPL